MNCHPYSKAIIIVLVYDLAWPYADVRILLDSFAMQYYDFFFANLLRFGMIWPLIMLESSDLNVVGLLSKSFVLQYYEFFFANLLRFGMTICIRGGNSFQRIVSTYGYSIIFANPNMIRIIIMSKLTNSNTTQLVIE